MPREARSRCRLGSTELAVGFPLEGAADGSVPTESAAALAAAEGQLPRVESDAAHPMSARVAWAGLTAVAIIMIGYHLWYTQVAGVAPTHHQNIHLALALLIVTLATIRRWLLAGAARLALLLGVPLLLTGVATTSYMALNHDPLLLVRGRFPDPADLVVGVLLICCLLIVTKTQFGWIFPSLAIIGILYAVFGSHLPGALRAASAPAGLVIARFTMFDGIYGSLLGLSATYLFLFIVFGYALKASGATVFFYELGSFVANKIRGGTSFSAVILSCLMGTVTGAVTANVVTTGSFTIPLMKEEGVPPARAAAIEAVASTGGQILPPLMGVAAFLIAGLTGIPLSTILVAAIIPGGLYFLALGTYVYLKAVPLSTSREHRVVDRQKLLLGAPIFFIPLTVLVVMFVQGLSPMYAIFWAFTATCVSSAAIAAPMGWTSWRAWGSELMAGAQTGAQIAVVVATLGILLKAMVSTGLGIRLPGILTDLAQGNFLLIALFAAMAAIILGLGLPTAAVYALVGAVAAPVLVASGTSVLQAHYFVFFYGVLGFITPPVAIAAVVAARIADADLWPTMREATKAGAGAFLIPWLFLTHPVLLLDPSATWDGMVLARDLGLAILLILCVQMMMAGRFRRGAMGRRRQLLWAAGTLVLGAHVLGAAAWMLGVALPLLLVAWVPLGSRPRNNHDHDHAEAVT